MRYLIHITFISILKASCSSGGSTNIPQPSCEQGGTEVKTNE